MTEKKIGVVTPTKIRPPIGQRMAKILIGWATIIFFCALVGVSAGAMVFAYRWVSSL